MIIEEVYIPKIKLNIKFLVGKNANDNFNIIDQSDENDLWFHINDAPSCHVIACIHQYNINKKNLKYVIKQGGIICKKHSKYKSKKYTTKCKYMVYKSNNTYFKFIFHHFTV